LDGATYFALTSDTADAENKLVFKDQRVLDKMLRRKFRRSSVASPRSGCAEVSRCTSPTVQRMRSPDSIIKDEELLLPGRGELVYWAKAQGDFRPRQVRQNSLAPADDAHDRLDDAEFIAGLLYERRFSLLWEQGTRWIDARRFGCSHHSGQP